MSVFIAQMGGLSVHPLTSDRWADFGQLFGERGAWAACWCMWWRLKRADWQAQAGEGNRLAMQAIVASGEVPGLLAYAGDDPVGWCPVAPRRPFLVL